MLRDDATRAQLGALAPTHQRAGSQLLVTVPVRLKHPIGMLRAKVSEVRLNRSVERQQTGATLLLAITMLLIGVSLHFLHRRLVGKRLSSLTKVAVSFGKGNMGSRATESGTDEISELAGSFNKMALAQPLRLGVSVMAARAALAVPHPRDFRVRVRTAAPAAVAAAQQQQKSSL